MVASEQRKVADDIAAGPEALASAEASLRIIDDRVFASARRVSLGRHLSDLRLAVFRILGSPDGEPVRVSGDRPWSLAELVEADSFDRQVDMVAMAIADLFTLKVHLDVGALRAGHAVFIESLHTGLTRAADWRSFVEVVGRLIASLAARRIVSFSAMMRERSNRTAMVVLDWPNEIAALALGAALYTATVRRLTGEDPSLPLPALVLENAASLVRRRPESGAHFRELLQLGTPWT